MKIYYLFHDGDVYLLPDPQNNYAWQQLQKTVSEALGKDIQQDAILTQAAVLEVSVKAPTIREYLRAKASIEQENPNARIDEVLASLAEDEGIVKVIECSHGWTRFAEIPLPLQMVILGQLTRLTVGNPELPFRFGAGLVAGASEDREGNRYTEAGT